MRALGEVAGLFLLGCVFFACGQSVPEAQTTNPIPSAQSPDTVASIDEKAPHLIHEMECGNVTLRTYYRAIDTTPDPYEPSWISIRVVESASGRSVREYSDSAMVGFERIVFDSTHSRPLRCEEGYQFISCYEVVNDDHVVMKVLYCDRDTSFVVPLEWTPDGIYHRLYTSTIEQVRSLREIRPDAYGAINALTTELNGELNPEP